MQIEIDKKEATRKSKQDSLDALIEMDIEGKEVTELEFEVPKKKTPQKDSSKKINTLVAILNDEKNYKKPFNLIKT